MLRMNMYAVIRENHTMFTWNEMLSMGGGVCVRVWKGVPSRRNHVHKGVKVEL